MAQNNFKLGSLPGWHILLLAGEAQGWGSLSQGVAQGGESSLGLPGLWEGSLGDVPGLDLLLGRV